MVTESNSLNDSYGTSVSQAETSFDKERLYSQELQNLTPGERLGKYELIKETGVGGMGSIWKAKDTVSGLFVALKFVKLELQQHEEMMEKMRQVFILMQRLHHPNICPVLGLEKDETYGYFHVMQWLDGVTLEQARETLPGKKFPPAWGQKIVFSVAEALDYAHENGILHRDIKPSNIFLQIENKKIKGVQLIDFGISTEAPKASDRTSQVQMSTSGTPAYMALEQHSGEKQDARTDQFSLAVVAYELYSGKRPFQGDNMGQIIISMMRDTPAPIPEIPDYTNAALRKALSQNRKDRFDSCREFAKALGTPVKTAEHEKPQDSSEKQADQDMQAEESSKMDTSSEAEKEANPHEPAPQAPDQFSQEWFQQEVIPLAKEGLAAVEAYNQAVYVAETSTQLEKPGMELRIACERLRIIYEKALELRRKDLIQLEIQHYLPDAAAMVSAKRDIKKFKKYLKVFNSDHVEEMIRQWEKPAFSFGELEVTGGIKLKSSIHEIVYNPDPDHLLIPKEHTATLMELSQIFADIRQFFKDFSLSKLLSRIFRRIPEVQRDLDDDEFMR